MNTATAPFNPIAYTDAVLRSFLRYQFTTYAITDERLRTQMRDLLNLDHSRRTPLFKGPFISLSRTFKPGATVADMAKMQLLHPHLAQIASHPSLYGHQEEAIRAILERRPTLVSTGTGSGKTECFLYPIISRCLRLRDDHAKEGITAVLIYPMNALAEDQLERLRGLLAGTRITFGMYVGKTPDHESEVPGVRLKSCGSRADYQAAVSKSHKENPGRAVHPPEERCSREVMRQHPPRILLTNVKQLELLLTRQADVELFTNASLDFLVVDEAHTFTGAQGAETACLIRRLRAFCGRTADQTTCVATSATIADPQDPAPAQAFASRFFGVDTEAVRVVTESYAPDLWAAKRRMPASPAGDRPAVLAKVLAAADGGHGVAEALAALDGSTLPTGDTAQALGKVLSANELVYQIAKALEKPRALGELLEHLGKPAGRAVSEEELLAWLTLGAFARIGDRPLLRPVVHGFVRGVGGAVVTFPSGQHEAKLWFSAEAAESAGDAGAGCRLPVMTCTTCGQHYYAHWVKDFHFIGKAPGGGEASEGGSYWPALEESLGGSRLVLVDRLSQTAASDDEDDGGEDPDRTATLLLCRHCGSLHPSDVGRCCGCGQAEALVPLLAIQQKEDNEGVLTSCLTCKAGGRRFAGRYREPARPIRATAVADVHVLAQDMIHRAKRRRLLVFADNRQDAAFQAGWMRDHARRFRLRGMMYEHLAEAGPVGLTLGDLVARLDRDLDQDDDLSRSLIREVWDERTKESQGTEHQDLRRFYLRVSILKEITVGPRQRLGLEPWGRMRIVYRDLDAQSPFAREWAARLHLPADRLADGICALLDRARRQGHLHDEQTKVFGRIWMEGDREVQRGYLQPMKGLPKGLKLELSGDDDPNRLTKWLGERTSNWMEAVGKWGMDAQTVDDFLRALWNHLVERGILKAVTLKGSKGNPLPKAAGAHQIDMEHLTLVAHQGRWRCQSCRRTVNRPLPGDRCIAWRCHGTLVHELEDPDNYDLSLLDGNVSLLRPREHTAQVPHDERERIERIFKSEDKEAINALVCTQTMEMGVDIGQLDAVLMRNVPPLASNYWQRAGRAGRRHRMAVNLTYARDASHDRAYFAEPMKMLSGRIDPPSFNLRNDLMVDKHVHAAVLTCLHQLTREAAGLPPAVREALKAALGTMLPSQVRTYLFDEHGHIRQQDFDTAPLATAIATHREAVLEHVRSIFAQHWPEADQIAVQADRLIAAIDGMAEALASTIRTLHRRLEWALDQISRLSKARGLRGTLEPDEDALFQRCDRLIKRLKGMDQRRRSEASGHDDTNTYAVLAAEGFLPGYGLDGGGILGSALLPKAGGNTDFELVRPTAVAIREFIPGNRLYANGAQFIPRFFHLLPDQALRFHIDIANKAVSEVGQLGELPKDAVATLGTTEIPAIPMCDVDLPYAAHISDLEDSRYQLPVAVYGTEQGRHEGGTAYGWGDLTLLMRHNVHYRLVNVGASSEVAAKRPGFPLCLVCGASRSPFSSKADQEDFIKKHQERCGRAPLRAGFFADIVCDSLTLRDCSDRDTAYSLLESLRLASSDILDMEPDDLQILAIAKPGQDQIVDGVLYDPMPGGSGLIQQLIARFPEVATRAGVIADTCASGCKRSCIDCLQHFRNAFYHRHLDRNLVQQRLAEWGHQIVHKHDIPPAMPSTPAKPGAAPVNNAEQQLKDLLASAGFPIGEWQHAIKLGQPLGSTTVDCFYPDPNEICKGVCIYLDGLSASLHGNPQTAKRDQEIRDQLKAMEYEVLTIAAGDLLEAPAMTTHFARLARIIADNATAKRIKDDQAWYRKRGISP